ncbi:excinuclease ABC subunit C [Candidatus Dependentiae bacterium]|nr:excinuclease ABC subunit C [Candidatus Dependentiae bacterium]
MNEFIKNQINKLPHTPGVYFFKTSQTEMLYIGKAKDLRNRCSSYLQPKADDLKGLTIDQTATHFEFKETSSELEALLLEAELIQHHRPPLNVLLKDGQPFLYFLITTETVPRLILTRTKKLKGSYFGPFIEKSQARSLHAFLLKTFRLETCSRKMPHGCLRYHMGICAGTCKPDFDLTEYKKRLDLIKNLFVSGNKKLFAEIDSLIESHNEKMEFEVSKKLVDAKMQLTSFLAHKTSILNWRNSLEELTSRHIWIKHKNHVYLLEEKKLKFSITYTFLADSDEPIDTFMSTYYQQYQPPRELMCNQELENKLLISQFLKTRWNQPQETLFIDAHSHHLDHIMSLALLEVANKAQTKNDSAKDLKQFLNLNFEPHVIDCFDISHLQGTNIVASCVRFVDGVPFKNGCRKFIIQSLTNQNDYAALQEAVSRRYKNQNELPDLILIDGGKGQLNAVRAVFDLVHLASIAKREERIFSDTLPTEGKLVNRKSKGGKTLMAIRDYAHHFAISFQRSRRSN